MVGNGMVGLPEDVQRIGLELGELLVERLKGGSAREDLPLLIDMFVHFSTWEITQAWGRKVVPGTSTPSFLCVTPHFLRINAEKFHELTNGNSFNF